MSKVFSENEEVISEWMERSMKFVCNKCGGLVGEENVIIIFETAFHTFTFSYCPSCYEKIRDEKNKRIEKLQERVKSKKWWQLIRVGDI